jgi:hypothetical protein
LTFPEELPAVKVTGVPELALNVPVTVLLRDHE